MSITIGELFVKLGVKGGDKTKKELGGVKKNMKGILTTGLAVGAALVAMGYAFKRLGEKSNNVGAGLSKFSASTGLSAETLQRWQYAARQFNVSSDEVEGSVRNLNGLITESLTGGAPLALGELSAALGGDFDTSRIKDTYYVLGKVNEAVQNVDPRMGQKLASAFGMSDGMLAAMREGVFTPEMLARANVYSAGQLKAGAKMKAMWSNLGDRVDKMVGRLNFKHGPKMIKEIAALTKEVLDLVDALIVFADKIKLFEVLAGLLNGIAAPLKIFSDMMTGDSFAEAFAKTAKSNKGNFFDKKMGEVNDYKNGAIPQAVGGAILKAESLLRKVDKYTGTSDLIKGGKELYQDGKKIFNQIVNISGMDSDPEAVGRAVGKHTKAFAEQSRNGGR